MQKPVSEYTVQEILEEDPYHLMELFQKEYSFSVPETLETIDDLRQAGKMMGKLANMYSYMSQLSAYAKIAVRTAKKDKGNKEAIDDAIDRKAVIDTFASTIELQYKAISRILTIKQQINEELKMTDGR